jgi:hypothetical protein
MTEYVAPEIEQDPAAIQQQMIDDLQAQVPGLEVKPATVVYYLLAVFAFLWAQLAELSSQVFSTIFRYYGQKIIRLAPSDAVSASTTVTFTAKDTNGPYLIPAGTEVNLAGADGSPVAFRTIGDVTIPNGSSTITPVTVVAAVAGAAGNSLSTFQSVTQTYSFWATIPATILSPTAGGADAEDDDTYQNRLADRLTLLANTLVIPSDFETWARGDTGVDRALAIDNYDSTIPGTVNGHITVALVNELGASVGSTVKAQVLAEFVANVQSNLVPHVIDAGYNVLAVVFAGKALPGYVASDVLSRATAALQALVNPANWGLPQTGDQRLWVDTPIVRFQDLVTALNNVEGFAYYAAPTGTATTTNASPNLTLVTPTTGWVNGMPISGTGIPAGTKILSGAGTATMVMTANATASAAGVAITGSGLSLNGGTADVTMTGPAALPSSASTVAGSVT